MTPKHPKPKFKKLNNHVRMPEMNKSENRLQLELKNIESDIVANFRNSKNTLTHPKI